MKTSLLSILAIPLISGCALLDTLTPNKLNNVRLRPILDRRTQHSSIYLQQHEIANQIARDITNSTETKFPEGRVIILEEQGRTRYLVSKVTYKDGGKDLKISIYDGSEFETAIRKHLSTNEHGPAITKLNRSYTKITSISYPRINTHKTRIDHLLTKTNEQGQTTPIRISGEKLINISLNILRKVYSSDLN